MSNGKALICDSCIWERDTMTLVVPGEVCRRCGHTPDPGAQTVGEIQRAVRD